MALLRPLSLVVRTSITTAVVAMGACASTPEGASLPDARASLPQAPVVHERTMAIATLPSVDELRASYAAAGMPTVGFIRDRYRLPIANPLGAARIIEGNLFGVPFTQTVTVPSTHRPYSIEPLGDGFMVQQLALVQQDLAQAGVRFVEVSTADANRIVDGEKRAAESNARMQWNELLPSGAQVLVTFQEATALGGPVYMVRAIRMADGALLALRTAPAQGGALALRPALERALADAFSAAAHNPLSSSSSVPSTSTPAATTP